MGPDETKKAFDLVQASARESPEERRRYRPSFSRNTKQNVKTFFVPEFSAQAAIEYKSRPD